MVDGFIKSGGFLYISKENNQVLLGHDHSNRAVSKTVALTVPCRDIRKVSPDRQRCCISFIDPERPGWYMTHRDGYLYFEPEYAPRNPRTFDKDASFCSSSEVGVRGFSTLESFSLPNHFLHSTTDDKVALSLMQDTPEFHDAASIYPVFRIYKGESNVIIVHFSSIARVWRHCRSQEFVLRGSENRAPSSRR